MLVEQPLPLKVVDVPSSFLLVFLFKLPKVFIFGQLFGVCDHFNDFTIRLELFENIDFDIRPVIDFFVVFGQVLELPLTQ